LVVASRERIFQLTETKYPVLYASEKAFQPYHLLWTTTSAFLVAQEEWLSMSFTTINRDDVESKVRP